jgi:hypothetical protein
VVSPVALRVGWTVATQIALQVAVLVAPEVVPAIALLVARRIASRVAPCVVLSVAPRVDLPAALSATIPTPSRALIESEPSASLWLVRRRVSTRSRFACAGTNRAVAASSAQSVDAIRARPLHQGCATHRRNEQGDGFVGSVICRCLRPEVGGPGDWLTSDLRLSNGDAEAESSRQGRFPARTQCPAAARMRRQMSGCRGGAWRS